ncbi:MAG TPA: M48 family metallopeptidase [Pyrinomonadaceae bacterium]|nr:M48 family metallopeptidase [Pyrinomonadaceae bacterium]
MNNRFSRVMTALLLALSLWTSALSAVAVPAQTQQEQQKSTQQDSKSKQDKNQQTAPVSTAKSSKPLSTDEDPSMIGKRKINGGFINWMAMGMEKEVALGRYLAAEIDRQAKFVDDPIITEYVNRVGQNIVLHSDAKVPFTIKVIDSDEVNAFALPGGFFYVNKGLILAADNEAELAGVMAHEIAHVAARHAVENQAKATLAEYGLLAGSIFLGGIPGLIINNAGPLAALLGFMKFSRDAESEADKLGVQYLYASGYDPNALATMFEKLASQNKKKPGFISKAFASHPQPPERRAASLTLVSRFPERDEYTISTSEFQKVKARLLRMSNAKASTAGNIAADENGSTPGRPTLKRRQPPPPEGATGTSESETPSDKQPTEAPKLKRNTGEGTTAPTSTQPKSTP